MQLNTLPNSQHHIRGSILLLGIRVFLALFTVEALYSVVLLYLLIVAGTESYHNLLVTILLIINACKFGIEAYVILRLIVRWAATTYYLSEHQIIYRSGIIDFEQDIYELNDLHSVNLRQNWLGRLLNYGDIEITLSASGYRSELILRGIADVKGYEHVLHGFLEKRNSGSSNPIIAPV